MANEREIAQAVADTQYLLGQNFADALAASLSDPRASRQIKALFQAVSAEIIPREDIRQVHEAVGKAAQRSVVQGYTHRRGRSRLAPYRTGGQSDPRNARYAGGALLRALQASDFYQATADGLGFINVSRLNKEARQWRRLNFGAGEAGGAAPQQFPMSLFNVAIGLSPDRRPGFSMPPGYFIGSNGEAVPPGAPGTAAFYPTDQVGDKVREGGPPLAPRRTKGIKATNFLDAGIRRIAEELPKSYQALYSDFFNDAPRRARFEQQLNVRAPRPRRPPRRS